MEIYNHYQRRFKVCLIYCAVILLLCGCRSNAQISRADVVRYSTSKPSDLSKLGSDNVLLPEDLSKTDIRLRHEPMTKIHDTVFDQALGLLGKKPDSTVYVNGKKFTLDCIGTVAAIFYGAGIDIMADAGKFYAPGDNGVAMFYKSLKNKNGVYKSKYPKPGDVIFWDNTWDRNSNGRFGDDPLTHVGLVTKVDDDGTIHYIHDNYLYGIGVETMNQYRPKEVRDENGKVINSALYMNSSESKKMAHPWLSGDLFREFGGVILSFDK
ncbi:MAG: CHAP domain-containing protein [Spirochaetales bacterium]|nr:CHAP domain-containing protein [Spirochaetales bacterium]